MDEQSSVISPEISDGEPITETAPVEVGGELPVLDTAIESAVDLTVKSLSPDGDKVGGYLVLFGSPEQRDLTGDYFTEDTNFCLDWIQERPILYHHGLNPKLGPVSVGVIKSIVPDEIGLWAEGELHKRHRYNAHIKNLIAKGALSWSSGSVQHLVRKAADKRIEQWPVVEGSLTPEPAEPRGTDVMPLKARQHLWQPAPIIQAYKALNLSIPGEILSLQEEAIESQETLDSSDAAAKSTGMAAPLPTLYRKKENIKKMDEKELQAQIANAAAQAVAQALTVAKEKEEAALKAAQDFEARVKAEAEKLAEQRLNDITRTQAPAKMLPVPTAPSTNPAAPSPKVDVRVIGDRRYAELSGEDLAFMTSIYNAADRTARQRQMLQGALFDDLPPFMREARAFMQRLTNDPDRKLVREISAKTIRQYNRREIPEYVLAYLPYKSLADVEANNWDETAVKAATLEAQRALQDDPAYKANELDSTGQTGYGLDWVPTIWNNVLWRRVRINNSIAQNMQQINMPSNPFNLPIESADPTVYYVAEGTDATQLVLGSGNTMTLSKVASDKKVLTAIKLGVRVGFSTELVEDSLIPILPIFRYQTTRQLQNYIDDTLLNGDTATGANTNINLIDGTPVAGTSYLALNGLRKFALVTNTAQALDFGGGAPTMALFRNLRKVLAKQYAVDIQNLVYIVGFEVYMKMLSLPEFSTYLNLGMPGSNVTGLLPNGSADQVGSDTSAMPVGLIDGIPVYVSAQFGLTNAAGKISGTPANNTFGQVVLFHRTRWYMGYKRQINVDLLPTGMFSDTYQLWGTVRFALTNFDNQCAAVGYDIAV
jgi:hypothetical protein